MSQGTGVGTLHFGPDAGELLVTLGVPVSRAVVISTLRSAAKRRGCYRIELEDGRIVKLRRSTTEDDARQYAHLVVTLGDPRLARVLGRRGDLTLEEWVPGTTLDNIGACEKHLIAGAELLGTLHATRTIGASSLPRTVSTQPVRDQLEADLRTVFALGAIDGRLATRLRAGAARREPGVASACAVVGRRVQRPYISRSSSVSTKGGIGRPMRMSVLPSTLRTLSAYKLFQLLRTHETRISSAKLVSIHNSDPTLWQRVVDVNSPPPIPVADELPVFRLP